MVHNQTDKIGTAKSKTGDQKEIPTPKTEMEAKLTIDNQVLILSKTYFKPSEHLFPNRRPLSYSNIYLSNISTCYT